MGRYPLPLEQTSLQITFMAQKSGYESPNSTTSPIYFYKKVNGPELERSTYMLNRILFIKVMKGTVKVEINEKEYNLTSHHFVFLPPHSRVNVIRSSYDMEASVVGFMMVLQDVILQKLGHRFFTYVFKQLVWQLSEQGEKALNAFCVMYESLCRQPVDTYSYDIANSLFNVFLLSFYQNVKELFEDSHGNSPGLNSLTARFAILLRENFKQHHSVSFYADQLCISSKYLTQVIKSTTGFTPKTAIDRSLGVEALFMLSNSSYNIQQISHQLGFPDQSYFGRFFKRVFGVSPLSYRQNPDMKLLQKLREESSSITRFEE